MLAACNYFAGRRQNTRHATLWLKAMQPIIKNNFARVGSVDNPAEEDDIVFEDHSSNEFPLLLGGRENLIYANLQLILE